MKFSKPILFITTVLMVSIACKQPSKHIFFVVIDRRTFAGN